MRIAVTVDVPDLAAGLAFYGAAFGFAEVARPHESFAVLKAGEARLLLSARAEGSAPWPGAETGRSYARHWTPVHLDFHVEDVDAVLARAVAAGAAVEADWSVPGRPRAAFLSDPFGHGFCLIGPPVA